MTTPDYSQLKKWELLRMVFYMPSEGSAAIFLLVAVQLLEAPPMAKAYIPATVFLGLLFTPGLLQFIGKLQIPVAKAASYLYFVSAGGFVLIALGSGLETFLVGVTMALTVPALCPPLITRLWQQKTPEHLRGTLFSENYRMGLISKILVGIGIAWWLDQNIEHYRQISWLFAAFMLIAGFCFRQIDSDPASARGVSAIKSFGLVFENKTFGILIVVWMLFGFANLATLPLRTEYLASGTEFPAYSPLLVVGLVEVLPTVLRLLSVTYWGKLFDKMDFLLLRVILNVAFAISLILFFVPSIVSQVVASVLFGIASGGGSIAWNLWVTKYAPEEQTSEYMAVHTFCTGFRGIAGPFVAYLALGSMSFSSIGTVAFGLVVISIVIILGLMRSVSRRALVIET